MDSFNPIDSSFPDSKRDQKYEIAGLFFLCILMCFDGKTVIIVQSDNNYTFGGYSALPWKSGFNDKWQKDDKM